jgi:acyl carrier protein
MAIEIIAEVERTYKLKIPEDELKTITNLDKMVSLVSQKLG